MVNVKGVFIPGGVIRYVWNRCPSGITSYGEIPNGQLS